MKNGVSGWLICDETGSSVSRAVLAELDQTGPGHLRLRRLETHQTPVHGSMLMPRAGSREQMLETCSLNASLPDGLRQKKENCWTKFWAPAANFDQFGPQVDQCWPESHRQIWPNSV